MIYPCTNTQTNAIPCISPTWMSFVRYDICLFTKSSSHKHLWTTFLKILLRDWIYFPPTNIYGQNFLKILQRDWKYFPPTNIYGHNFLKILLRDWIYFPPTNIYGQHFPNIYFSIVRFEKISSHKHLWTKVHKIYSSIVRFEIFPPTNIYGQHFVTIYSPIVRLNKFPGIFFPV